MKNADKITVTDPLDIYQIMRLILKREQTMDRSKEHLWTIALNLANKIVNIELVGLGSFRTVACEPADVFSIPLQKKAAKLTLIHNHPSGNLKPSQTDIDLTDRLTQVGRIHNCRILDHLIINDHSYFSFLDNGLTEKLNNSSKFVPSHLYEKWQKENTEKLIKKNENEKKQIAKVKLDEGRKEGLQKGEEKGKKAEKKEIARKMLAEGESIDKIMMYTGIPKQWIGRLRNELTPN